MNNLEKLLLDMSYNSTYRILEEGKDDKKIAEIAKKKGIKLPCHELAIFECIYAFVDRQNLNGCTLPKEEVKKAINTLIGKAVDFDHMRERVVGYWIDAKLEGDKIIAYGIFFKGNFVEDYGEVKNLMEKDILGISFEAWGNREYIDATNYNLTDIEFAGGALLIKTDPAFPGSQVLEMSNNKILEFAKVMVAPKQFFHLRKGNKKDMEESNLIFEDIPTIRESMSQIECPTCKEKGYYNILMIDLEKFLLRSSCIYCETKIKIDLKPTIKILKKGKKPTKTDLPYKSEVVDIMKKEVKELIEFAKMLDIDISSIDLSKEDAVQSLTDFIDKEGVKKIKCMSCDWVGETTQIIAKSTPCPKCGGSVKLVSDIANKDKYGGKNMEKIKELELKIAKLEEEKKEVEEKLSEKETVVEELKKESDEVKGKIEEVEKNKEKEIAKAREEAKKIADRRNELGETELSDEEILDDDKFELAKTKKILAEKEAEVATLKEKIKTDPDFDKGSYDEKPETKADKVQRFAWGEE